MIIYYLEAQYLNVYMCIPFFPIFDVFCKIELSKRPPKKKKNQISLWIIVTNSSFTDHYMKLLDFLSSVLTLLVYILYFRIRIINSSTFNLHILGP